MVKTIDDGLGLDAHLRQQAPIALDATLSCARGELLALVGPSGSGKSTLLRAIAGLYRLRQGHIRCGGETWFDAAQGIDRVAQQRHVGFVFQSYALFPHLDALANVMEAMRHQPATQRERLARELLARVRLQGLEARYPRQLSGGQQQRVALARALAREPRVLLMDEPFSAVDRATREQLYQELAELRQKLDMPVVLVTHDLDEAHMLADRMTLLHHGRTLQTGAPLEVMHAPLSATVARLMGQRNLFEATVLAHENNATLLRWGSTVLTARAAPAIPVGSQVTWMIPSAFIRVIGRDGFVRPEWRNPCDGTITSLVTLGDRVIVRMQLHEAVDAERPLTFSLPTHVARRNVLMQGDTLRVWLLAEGIHLMQES